MRLKGIVIAGAMAMAAAFGAGQSAWAGIGPPSDADRSTDVRKDFVDGAPVGKVLEVPADLGADIVGIPKEAASIRSSVRCDLKAGSVVDVKCVDEEFGVLLDVVKGAPFADTVSWTECPARAKLFVTSGRIPVRQWGPEGTMMREWEAAQARETAARDAREARMRAAVARIEAAGAATTSKP